MIDLRPYQQESIDAVWGYWARGGMHPLVVLPTGAGKSMVLGSLAHRIVDGGGQVLIATHRAELIAQNERACLRFFEERQGRKTIGVYSAGLRRREVRQITVGGVQSLFRKTGKLGAVDVLIVDEAHLVPPKTDTQYGKLIDGLMQQNPEMRICGLTATPYRLGQGMLTDGDGIFTSMVYQADIKNLINDGYLSKLVSAASAKQIDLGDVRTSAGDYVLADLENAADVDEITNTVIADVLASGRGHVLVYCTTVAHAMRMRNAFRMAGVATECITGETHQGERQRILRDFGTGQVRVLTSCDVLTTGLDVPSIDCIALVRPTKSAALYVQMCGRGARLAPGKADCLILDYGHNIQTHGPIDQIKLPEPRAAGAGKGKAPSKLCRGCFAQNPVSATHCSECDLEFPERKAKVQRDASKLDIISKEKAEPVRRAVDKVQWSEHLSKSSGQRLLRVDYFGPGSTSAWHPLATDWVCVEHTGFARLRAEQWWRTHVQTGHECPADVDQALEFDDCKKTCIAVWTVPDGKYQKITGYEFAMAREPGQDDDESSVPADDAAEDDSFDFDFFE